jgi:hypothetical protein
MAAGMNLASLRALERHLGDPQECLRHLLEQYRRRPSPHLHREIGQAMEAWTGRRSRGGSTRTPRAVATTTLADGRWLVRDFLS